MILDDIRLALGQLGDQRFRRVLGLGIGLTIALLVGVYALFLGGLNWLLPDSVTLPWIGQVAWIDDLLTGGSVILLLILSVFLMIPVASAFTGLFLEDVTDAVEAEHYPQLTPAPRIGFAAGLQDSLNYFAVLVVANLAALILYLMFLPAAPLIFLALNGYLLSREYFHLIAARRLGRAGAKALRRRHAGQVWLAGILMALPLTIPVVNLLVPIIGAATFTHLFHRVYSANEG
jgi:CysZ protein